MGVVRRVFACNKHTWEKGGAMVDRRFIGSGASHVDSLVAWRRGEE